MGLKDQKEYQEAATTPAFEAMEPETTTTTKEETMNTTTIEQQASADVAATTAIATAATTAVAMPGKKFVVAFKDYNNVFDTTTVEALALAAPRVKGEQGCLFKNDEDLGGKIRIEIISFNHRWVVGTGENDAEAKDFFKVSFDNKTISGSGADFHDYLEKLKADGFNKARISPYMDIWCFIVWTEKKGDIPVDDRELCCLQCSQTSLGNFTAFCTTRGLLESKGVAKPSDVIEVTAQKQQNKNGDRYTNFLFSAPKM